MNPLTANPAIALMAARRQQAENAARTQLLRNARLAVRGREPRPPRPRTGLRVPRWAYALRLRAAAL